MEKIVEVVLKGERRGGNRVYSTPADRKRAVAGLRRAGFNHFTFYSDTAGPVALQYGKASWVEPGDFYVNR